MIPGLRSIYRWEGKVEDEAEALLVLKTTRARFEALRDRVLALHPYAVPEVLALADRILVMREGRLQGEIPGREATEERVMRLATHEAGEAA